MNIYVAMPAMDYINTQSAMSLLSLKSEHDVRYGMTIDTMVQDARNNLTAAALQNGCDRVLWVDSDMIVPPDLIDRLSKDLDDGHDFVTALYFTRKDERRPVLFESLSIVQKGDRIIPNAEFYLDYPKDSLFKVAGCGFGACMMNVDVLQRVSDKYGAPFMLIPGFGEDISFCYRCQEIGIEVCCDSRIKCGHIGLRIYKEDDYLPGN